MTTPREPWQIEEARKRLEEVKRKHQQALDALADAEKRLEEARAALHAARKSRKQAWKDELLASHEIGQAREDARQKKAQEVLAAERKRDEVRTVNDKHRQELRDLEARMVEHRRKFEEERQAMLGQKREIERTITESAITVEQATKHLREVRGAGVVVDTGTKHSARDARRSANEEISKLRDKIDQVENEIAELTGRAEDARAAIATAQTEYDMMHASYTRDWESMGL